MLDRLRRSEPLRHTGDTQRTDSERERPDLFGFGASYLKRRPAWRGPLQRARRQESPERKGSRAGGGGRLLGSAWIARYSTVGTFTGRAQLLQPRNRDTRANDTIRRQLEMGQRDGSAIWAGSGRVMSQNSVRGSNSAIQTALRNLRTGRLKTREWKTRHEMTWVENAGVTSTELCENVMKRPRPVLQEKCMSSVCPIGQLTNNYS